MPNDHIYAVALEILATAVDILETEGRVVPPRRFVTFGEIGLDCNLLAVGWQNAYAGIAGQPDQQPEGLGFVQRAATFDLRRLRCVSSLDERGTPPSPDALNAEAEELLTDLWTIYQGFVERKSDRTFLTSCDGFSLGNAIAVGPQGGVGGWSLPMDVQIL